MHLEFYSEEKLKKQILGIISKYVDLKDYRIFLFGSRVSGKSTERSDIDIGIEGPIQIPRETMTKIREEIENLPTLYKIDLVDFKRVAPDFKEVALGNTEIIYPTQ